jgi:hypothetical protein
MFLNKYLDTNKLQKYEVIFVYYKVLRFIQTSIYK